jgi:hypothetical protein
MGCLTLIVNVPCKARINTNVHHILFYLGIRFWFVVLLKKHDQSRKRIILETQLKTKKEERTQVSFGTTIKYWEYFEYLDVSSKDIASVLKKYNAIGDNHIKRNRMIKCVNTSRNIFSSFPNPGI